MKIILIAAIGKNNELGKNNDLIWNLPNDLKFYRHNTLNKTVVLGYNTYKSLPNKLKNRKMIVLTNRKIDDEEIITYKNEYELLKNEYKEDLYIIGGEQVYKTFIDIADELYITKIDATTKADTYFPKFNETNYNKQIIDNNIENEISYTHIKYIRKNKLEKGKLISIEGTDCSGKATQTSLLLERLRKDNIKVSSISFPMYDSPTGAIIGACLLGKSYLCNEYFKDGIGSWFEEGANIDPLVAIDLYAADRRYNLPKINALLNRGINVILDRYVTSNMAHRGGMILDKKQRLEMYEIIKQKEYVLNKLPYPDATYLLYMPYEQACILKKNRQEIPDVVENDEVYLKNGEKAYLELANLYNYDIINCTNKEEIRKVEDINEELYHKVKKLIRG